MASSKDLSAQFDVTPKEMRMIEERAKTRAAFRHEFLKETYNPHRGTGGYLFDPAMQRWISARSQHWYYFKPTFKSGAVTAFVVFVCIGYGHMIQKDRDRWEEKYRTGQVSYRDRQYKFA